MFPGSIVLGLDVSSCLFLVLLFLALVPPPMYPHQRLSCYGGGGCTQFNNIVLVAMQDDILPAARPKKLLECPQRAFFNARVILTHNPVLTRMQALFADLVAFIPKAAKVNAQHYARSKIF